MYNNRKMLFLATTKTIMYYIFSRNSRIQINTIIILLVLDILDLMEFANGDAGGFSVEQENVKIAHSILMNFFNITKILVMLVRQMAKHVFQHQELVIPIKVLPPFVLYILVLMDIVKEPVQQLKLLAYQQSSRYNNY
ncbi:unnamed protein product [Paramecium pentaurelia]|uniref:Uncharacterized protein n=1 Tax=Paramecium pentaurelia TaxID=43138 RepID=A0A8S1XB49_9CILI|nr:unnamed protein product [Paramecium pentaurelia]